MSRYYRHNPDEPVSHDWTGANKAGGKTTDTMNTLLVIMSHSGANETVKRHWPHYLKGGCDILGVGRTDTNCEWPGGGLAPPMVGFINVGKESYANGDNHIVRFLDVLDLCMTLPSLKKYQAFCLVEYDTLLFGPIPKIKPGTFMTKLAGHRSEGFAAENYYHTPWLLDRIMAGRILTYGRAMLKAGLIERGFIDRWLGLLFDLHGIKPVDTGASTFTFNTIDTPEKMSLAKQAIADGIWFLHGCKTPEQLAQLTA